MCQKMKILILFFALCYIPSGITQELVEKANFKQASEWTVDKQLERIKNIWTVPLWIPGQDAFIYRHGTTDEIRYQIADALNGSKNELFDRQKLSRYLEKRLDTTLTWKQLDIKIIGFEPEKKRMDFQFNNLPFSYFTNNDSLIAFDEKDNRHSSETIYASPDGKYMIISGAGGIRFVKAGEKEKAVRLPRKKLRGYNLVASSIRWSPDSRYVASTFENWTLIQDMWLVDHYNNPRPSLQTFKWPLPNEEIENHILCIYDTKRKRLVIADAERWLGESYSALAWSPDSRNLYFQRMSRDWKSLDLCRVNPETGVCRSIIEEREKRQPITRPPYHILNSTAEIIWWSWHDGWGQYYLYGADGKMKNQITQDDFNAGEVIRIDEDGRILYFMGNARETGRNPYYHYLYASRLDSDSLILLTPEDAEHQVYFSETGSFFVDNYSRANMAPRTVVRDNGSNLILRLQDADMVPLEDAGWQQPEIFRVKAGDGQTDIWGIMFKPYDFDPAKKYPVITYGYPGKEQEALPWKFYHNYWVTLVSTSLAQYGFIVVVSGNRGGTWERSYDYYNYGEENLRDYPVEDKKAVIEQLASQYAFIDTSRVGIMGQSSGGLLAATAILLEPDFFKVAVSKCGNHDNNLFYHIWNERYGMVTEGKDDLGNTKFYSKSRTNNELASNLKGKLLLVQGDMDRVVPPSLTYRLAYDLMMANKRFDLFIIPNAGHYWGNNYPYVIKTIELYFVEHLMGDDTWEVDL